MIILKSMLKYEILTLLENMNAQSKEEPFDNPEFFRYVKLQEWMNYRNYQQRHRSQSNTCHNSLGSFFNIDNISHRDIQKYMTEWTQHR